VDAAERRKKTPGDILDFFDGEHQKILLTPPQDYDDGYTLELARRRNALIVSNDKFRDFIIKEKDSKKFKIWLDQRLCSYAFVGDEFIPNPAIFR
jgi:signal peptidase I